MQRSASRQKLTGLEWNTLSSSQKVPVNQSNSRNAPRRQVQSMCNSLLADSVLWVDEEEIIQERLSHKVGRTTTKCQWSNTIKDSTQPVFPGIDFGSFHLLFYFKLPRNAPHMQPTSLMLKIQAPLSGPSLVFVQTTALDCGPSADPSFHSCPMTDIYPESKATRLNSATTWQLMTWTTASHICSATTSSLKTWAEFSQMRMAVFSCVWKRLPTDWETR